MPAATSTTFAAAVTDVLARCGQLDDGVANPLLVAEAKAHINAAQAQLALKDWLRQRRVAQAPIAASQRFADIPSDVCEGEVSSARWVDSNGTPHPLAGEIPGDSADILGLPSRWELMPTTGLVSVTVAAAGSGYSAGDLVAVSNGSRGAYGHDPVVTVATVDGSGGILTVTVSDVGSEWITAPTLTPAGGTAASLVAVLGPVTCAMIWPIPELAGTLELRYKAGVVQLVEDGDALALDAESVVGRAAWILASTKRLPGANMILSLHKDHLDTKSTKQTQGGTMNLSGHRSGK